MNRIEKILGGKVIQETFEIMEGKAKGFKGMSVSYFTLGANLKSLLA